MGFFDIVFISCKEVALTLYRKGLEEGGRCPSGPFKGESNQTLIIIAQALSLSLATFLAASS
jgi:hypothetical protein